MKRVRSFPALPGLFLSLCLAGCSNDAATSAQFAASLTPASPGLVKLAQSSVSGAQVNVDVLLYGPEPGLDLDAFRFTIKISDPSVVRFVPQASYEQSALVAAAGQTIDINVGTPDASLVNVEIAKRGGGAGNGFTSPAALVVRLTFEALGSGGASLSFVGAEALASNGAPIEVVRFDTEGASVAGSRTGGGGY